MKQIFEIQDETIINEMLQTVEYGTLALCKENKPYSLPLNFVKIGDVIYFHGSKKGRKIDILQENSLASLSVVKSYSLIQSYFSSDEGLACPATQFFKSIIIDGKIEFIDEYSEKANALEALMQKLQSEGGYKPLSEAIYKRAIGATTIYKLIPQEIRAKFKFGQHLTQERFDMILKHLKDRGTEVDIQTLKMMKSLRDDAL